MCRTCSVEELRRVGVAACGGGGVGVWGGCGVGGLRWGGVAVWGGRGVEGLRRWGGAGGGRCAGAAGGRLVTNAVTLEAEASTITRHTAHGGRLTRIALEFADAIGGFTIMRPAQPVLQWRWVAS